MAIPGSDNALAASRDQLTHVYWIGGGSGAGKSTVARQLAEHHHVQLYETDAVMGEHGLRTTAAESPAMAKFAAMNNDERWVTRTPEVMLASFHWFRGEAFDLIINDLISLPNHTAIIAEGFRLLPRLVKPLLTVTSRALWLLPTPEFRYVAFHSRGPTSPPWSFVGLTTNPQRALSNLLQRDHLFTERLDQETAALQLPTLRVDTSITKDQLLSEVSRRLGLPIM